MAHVSGNMHRTCGLDAMFMGVRALHVSTVITVKLLSYKRAHPAFFRKVLASVAVI